MTRGRRALLAILAVTRTEFVAARLGVSEAAVRNWASGRSTPGGRARTELERNYRIARDSWRWPVGATANRRA